MPKIHLNYVYTTIYKFFGVLLYIFKHRKTKILYTLLNKKDGENKGKGC